jgi:hypothetical protein
VTATQRAPEDVGSDVLAGLQAVIDVLRQVGETAALIEARRDYIERLRADGVPFAAIVASEPRPLIVEMVTQSLDQLGQASSRFRRAEARALYDDGLTLAEIASYFGVSHQRVSALVRDEG